MLANVTTSTTTSPPPSPRYQEEAPPTGRTLVPVLIALFVVAMYAGAWWLTLPVAR